MGEGLSGGPFNKEVPEVKSDEDLLAEQDALASKVENDRLKATEEANRAAALKQNAESVAYPKRDEYLNKINETAIPVKEKMAEGIKEKIESKDHVNLEKSAIEAQLKASLSEIEALRVKADDFLKRKNDAEEKGLPLIEGLTNRLNEINNSIKQVEESNNSLSDKIKNLESLVISDEEENEYNQLLDKINQLNSELEALEAQNPEVVELIHEEGVTENNCIEQLVGVAMSVEYYDTKIPVNTRKGFVSNVVSRFFEEEVEALGINKIHDKGQREVALRELATGMVEGMKTSDNIYDKLRDLPNERAVRQFAGRSLASFVGNYGSSIFTHLANADSVSISNARNQGPESPGKDREAAARQAKIHLGTLNYVRAFASGLVNDWDRDIMKSAKDANKDVYTGGDLNGELGFISEGKPIIPPGMSEHEKNAAIQQFEFGLRDGKEARMSRRKELIDKDEKLLEGLKAQLSKILENRKHFDDADIRISKKPTVERELRQSNESLSLSRQREQDLRNRQYSLGLIGIARDAIAKMFGGGLGKQIDTAMDDSAYHSERIGVLNKELKETNGSERYKEENKNYVQRINEDADNLTRQIDATTRVIEEKNRDLEALNQKV